MGKYQVNEKFFDKIDSEEKAYWLGFILADGCITRYLDRKYNLYKKMIKNIN